MSLKPEHVFERVSWLAEDERLPEETRRVLRAERDRMMDAQRLSRAAYRVAASRSIVAAREMGVEL